MKFRVIQSNNRGLISKVGDKTFYSRKPKLGEETIELPTLFIWVNSPYRYAARAWTKWSGEQINKDYIYLVTKFRNVIDISGMNQFHQWSSQYLRLKLWQMKGKEINLLNHKCPDINEVWEGNRTRDLTHLKKRRNLINSQLTKLTDLEKWKINDLYVKRNSLNLDAGFIKFHVDHIKPLSKGGKHNYKNLRIISAHENQIKGSKILN